MTVHDTTSHLVKKHTRYKRETWNRGWRKRKKVKVKISTNKRHDKVSRWGMQSDNQTTSLFRDASVPHCDVQQCAVLCCIVLLNCCFFFLVGLIPSHFISSQYWDVMLILVYFVVCLQVPVRLWVERTPLTIPVSIPVSDFIFSLGRRIHTPLYT